MLNNCQAKTRPAFIAIATFLYAVKTLKKAWNMHGFDAWAVVFDLNVIGMLDFNDTDAEFSANITISNSIIEQIGKDL